MAKDTPALVTKVTQVREQAVVVEEFNAAKGKLASVSEPADKVKILIDGAPVSPYDIPEKQEARKLIFESLLQIKDLGVNSFVNGLSQKQSDVLMKYLYVALETDPENANKFLKIHVAVTKRGVGSIVRVMHEKSLTV
ncbi:ARP2/3 complex, 16kDa subunit (p16-Arc) [Carpediemonas membranifera]|uniref:Actin-related protein 2/3 complex subunit 5 n=1 Tax=Carpediemonas membranifera TaxID=201153 RepID=A0A8J6B0K0_9EUKA|nr:ARP2/3 complex, 16kDa subunit (p16-Arc) [Carpediemonas membranifera]|eukprot:KAG9396725.1 ARP2/3 complex, 16kDa subunit (p16-Arc) [Carpediemonas membranifera]